MNEIELFKLEQLESQRKIGLYEDEDKEGYRPVQNFKYVFLSEKVNPTNAYKNLFMKLHKSSNWEHSNSYKIEIDHKETSNPHMFGGKIELDGFTSNHIFSSEVKPGLIHKITADENKTTIAFFKYEVNQGYSFHSNPLLIFKSPKEDLNIIKNKTELTFRKNPLGESGLEFETLKTVAHIERIEEKSDNIVLEKIKEEVKKETVLTRSFKEEIHRENYIYPLKEGDIKLERLDDKTIQVLFKPHLTIQNCVY